jgi:hypothetical protein
MNAPDPNLANTLLNIVGMPRTAVSKYRQNGSTIWGLLGLTYHDALQQKVFIHSYSTFIEAAWQMTKSSIPFFSTLFLLDRGKKLFTSLRGNKPGDLKPLDPTKGGSYGSKDPSGAEEHFNKYVRARPFKKLSTAEIVLFGGALTIGIALTGGSALVLLVL